MRVLAGTKLAEAPPGWRERIESEGRAVVIDLGAGDGRFVYESARRDPGTLYVAVDPDAETLKEYAYRAARKPARGGVENATFVVASLEALPDELDNLAERVRINFPWGGLMRGLLEPQPDALQQIASLLRPAGVIEIVMSYDPEHDPNAFAGDPLHALDGAYIESVLAPAYDAAGFELSWRRMTTNEALALDSTWGRRLLHARPRQVYFLTCVPRSEIG